MMGIVRKTILPAIIALGMATEQPLFAQQQTHISGQIQNTLKRDSFSHEEMMTKNAKDILREYGYEKGMNLIKKHMLIEINKLREGNHLMALELDLTLDSLALSHAQDMTNRNYYAHTTPDGIEPRDRAKQSSYKGSRLAENMDKVWNIATVLQRWYDHKEHRDNLLRPDATYIGIGFASQQDKGQPFSDDFFVVELGK